MKKMKYLRTWLVAALLVTIIGSLTGGTVAWFTDSVESTGNIIETGTLDVKLYAVDKKAYDEASATEAGFTWTADHEIKNESPALFDYKLWEPGYTSVKYVKIENAGNLAFKWHLNVKPAMSPEFADTNSTLLQDTITLAKNMEVYVAPAATYNTFAELKNAADDNVYNLFDLFAASMNIAVDENGNITSGKNSNGAVQGALLPKGATYAGDATAEYKRYVKIEKTDDFVVALHMKEEAGNECQGLSISDGFVIELRASQYMYEEDSFGNKYDEDASNDLPTAFVLKLSDEELAEIKANNTNVELDVGYIFSTTETPAQAEASSYRYWHADFEVSFNQAVAADKVGIAGSYGEWGWLSFNLDYAIIAEMKNQGIIKDANATAIPANTPLRLLKFAGAAMNNANFSVNYEELCSGVVKFICGAYEIDAPEGLVMTVKLNLYETVPQEDSQNNSKNEETGDYITIGTFTHTF